MTNTIAQVLAYAKAHPTRNGKSWAGWCESFVWRAGGFDGSFASAMLAGDASGWLNPNWATAPPGALHYWGGVGGDGHVAFELGGGALLMASSQVSSLGTALGTIHFLDYDLPEYRGWSLRHGTQTLASAGSVEPSTPAGGTGKPIAPHEGDEDMARIVTVGKNQHLVGATRSTKIDNPDDATTLRKYLGGADTLTEAEHNTVKEYLWRLSPIHDGVPGADGWQSLGGRVADIDQGARA